MSGSLGRAGVATLDIGVGETVPPARPWSYSGCSGGTFATAATAVAEACDGRVGVVLAMFRSLCFGLRVEMVV
jgi:hypothetical protein